ncbi:DciA family protein [Streptomyces angustmyceticus]|uniref:DciA family protein n=1 Tax=Streptomyces angustmyceticus TaxID=285578 RepID=UPI00344E2F9E
MTEPQLSGADLAMQALRQARAAAKNQPSKPRRRPTIKRVDRGSGRDPKPVADLLDQLAVTYNWQRPSAAGLIMARWDRIAPQLADRAVPEHFDAETRTLHLRPVHATAAATLRWEAPQIPAALNQAVGSDTIAKVKILQPGPPLRNASAVRSQDPEPVPATAAPAVAWELQEPPAAFREALSAVRQAQAARRDDPAQEIRDRHFADIRGTLRESPAAFTEAQAQQEHLEQQARPRDASEAEAVQQAAIRRARDEKAGRAPALPTVFQRTA